MFRRKEGKWHYQQRGGPSGSPREGGVFSELERGGLNSLSAGRLSPHTHPRSLSTLVTGHFPPYVLAPVHRANHVICWKTNDLFHCEGKCGWTGLTERRSWWGISEPRWARAGWGQLKGHEHLAVLLKRLGKVPKTGKIMPPYYKLWFMNFKKHHLKTFPTVVPQFQLFPTKKAFWVAWNTSTSLAMVSSTRCSLHLLAAPALLQ